MILAALIDEGARRLRRRPPRAPRPALPERDAADRAAADPPPADPAAILFRSSPRLAVVSRRRPAPSLAAHACRLSLRGQGRLASLAAGAPAAGGRRRPSSP